MADLTQNFDLTSDWVNITSQFSLANGSSYLLDLVPQGPLGPTGTVVAAWAMTDNSIAPTVTGHSWAAKQDSLSSQSRHAQRNGANLWMKIITGKATLVCTQV